MNDTVRNTRAARDAERLAERRPLDAEAADERLSNSSAVARQDRGDDSLLESRRDRVSDERDLQDREASDDERVRMLDVTGWQDQLPSLPPFPGYHVCWLTMTNPRDPIHGRLRLGYELIKVGELPGWEHASLKTGDYAGYIGVSEMIAAKIPTRLYARYMKHFHHDRPNADEEQIDSIVDRIREDAAKKGLKVEEGDGTKELAQGKPTRPVFEGVP